MHFVEGVLLVLEVRFQYIVCVLVRLLRQLLERLGLVRVLLRLLVQLVI